MAHGDRGGAASPKKKPKKRRPLPPSSVPMRTEHAPVTPPKPTRADKRDTVQARKFDLPPWHVPPPAPPKTPRRRSQPQPLHPLLGETLYPSRPYGVQSPVTRRFVKYGRTPAPPSIPDVDALLTLPSMQPKVKKLSAAAKKKKEDAEYRDAILAPVSPPAQRRLGKRMTNAERAAYWANMPSPVAPPPIRPDMSMRARMERIAGEARTAGIPGQFAGAIPDFFGRVEQGGRSVIAGLPAMAAQINAAAYQDVTDPERNRFPGSRTFDLAGGMSADALRGIHASLGGDPNADLTSWRGLPGYLTPHPAEAAGYFWEHPVESALGFASLIAPPLRAGSVASLTSRILRENPGMSLVRAANLARRESYRPGLLASQGIRGGLDPRLLTARVPEGGERVVAAKPRSTTPFGRAAQKAYDAASTKADPNGVIRGRFSTQRRAVGRMERQMTSDVERAALLMQQNANDIAKYIRGDTPLARGLTRLGIGRKEMRARMAGLAYALHGPEGGTAAATLRAVRDDLQETLDTGGKEIPTKARLIVEKRQREIEELLEKSGLGIDETGLWTDYRNVMHERGWNDAQVETIMRLEKLSAMAWARRKPGRDPSDFLASPEGRNLGGFLNNLPDTGLENVLFQEPGTEMVRWEEQPAGWNMSIVRQEAAPDWAPGDVIWDSDGTPVVVKSLNPGGTMTLIKEGRQYTVGQENKARFRDRQSMQPGQRVAQKGTKERIGTVIEVNPEAMIVKVKTDRGTEEHIPLTEIQPPGPTRFYSKMTRVLMEKMPNKASTGQILALLKKEGVKDEEVLWSGFRDHIDFLEAHDVKSVSKQDILDWIHGESQFNVQEIFLSPDAEYGLRPAYGSEGYTTRPGSPDYREVILTLGGPKIYSHGHYGSIANPIVHIRFIYDDETKTLYINEIQSDWHKEVRYHLADEDSYGNPKTAGILIPHGVTDEEWNARINDLRNQEQAILDEGKSHTLSLLGVPESEWDQWGNTPIRTLTERINQETMATARARIREAGGDYRAEQDAGRVAVDAVHATPEFQRLVKLGRIEGRYLKRSQKINEEANMLSSAMKTPPFEGKKWRQLALRWAVGEAVKKGYDKVAWDAGIVHAVRYGKVDVGDGDYDHYDYDTPEPDTSDYEYATTEGSIDFVPPIWPTEPQMPLFGTGDPRLNGSMDVRYALDDLLDDYDEGDLGVGMSLVPQSGQLEGQLVEIVGVDENGVRLRPSGVTEIRFTGRSESPGSSYGELERTITISNPSGAPSHTYNSFYGDIESASGHLDDLNIIHHDDVHDAIDSEVQSNLDWEVDQDAYDEAYAEWQENVEARGGGISDPEEINALPDPTYIDRRSGEEKVEKLVTLYDAVYPNEVSGMFKKKYQIEARTSTRRGQHTSEAHNWSSDEGPIKVQEFDITDKLADDVRDGQSLFQRQEGVPIGASWYARDPEQRLRRYVALLEGGNVSTFFHEVVGHGVHELSGQFPKEWAAVEKAMKKPLADWTEREHERFATWTERYFMEGKAPYPEIAPFLKRVRNWMRQVYTTIKALGRPIPQEARDLLDKTLGKTDEGTVFSKEELALIREQGELSARRAELIKQETDSLVGQPDADALARGREVMRGDNPKEQQAAYSEIAQRRRGKEGKGKPSEEQRMLHRQIELLERAIKEADDPESGFQDALAATVTMSEEAERLFRETITDLAPADSRPGIEDSLLRRRNILLDRLREKGLLPYGEGDALGYFPHASVFESLGKGLKGPVRQPQGSRRVLGKPRVTRQAVRPGPNLLRLYQSGNLNLDPRILLNTVNARVRLLQTREARDGLWEVGKPVKEPGDVPQGWWIINREGKYIPERLRRAQELTDEEMDDLVAAGEDFDSNVETRVGMDEFLEDYVGSFARPQDRVPRDWWKTGELRAVPPELVDGLLPKPFQGKPGSKAASTVGLLNAAVRVATILQYPVGYVLANVPANVLMMGLTHPTAIIRDLPRAVALRKTNPKLYQQLAQVAGDIMAEAGIPEFYARAQTKLERFERGVTRGQRRLAQSYGEVADTPFRVATLMGYARRYGIKDEAGLKNLVEGKGHEAMGDLRDALGQYTKDDLIDFDTLSQAEKETVARYMFLWPLIRGMAKWPFIFAREHPHKANLIAQMGMAENQEETPYSTLGTSAERALRHLSIVPTGGGKAVDISSINPMGGLTNIAPLLAAPERLTRGDIGFIRDTIAESTLPQIRELFRDNPSWRILLETTIPGAKMVTSTLGTSRGSKIWKREDWYDYMIQRNVRFRPEEVDAALMKSQAQRERREHTGTTAQELKLDNEYKALPAITRAMGLNGAELQEVDRGMQAYEYVSTKTRKLDLDGKVKLVNDAVTQFYPEYASFIQDPATMTDPEKENYYARVRDKLYATHSRVISTGRKMGLIEVEEPTAATG